MSDVVTEPTDDQGSPRRVGRPTHKRKMPRDNNAPKPPLNGYLRFLIERRTQKGPQFMQSQQTTQDALATLAREWKELPTDIRGGYLKKAEEDRIEYRKQLEAYKSTDSYKQFQTKLKAWENATKNESKSSSASISMLSSNDSKFSDETFGTDVQIFTKEFLDHNKERESELRRLRCDAVRLEDEQKSLNSNVCRLKHACDESQLELDAQRAYSDGLERHLSAYRKTLCQTFGHLPLPGSSHGPDLNTIDDYMLKVQEIMTHPNDCQEFLAKIRDSTKRIKLTTIS